MSTVCNWRGRKPGYTYTDEQRENRSKLQQGKRRGKYITNNKPAHNRREITIDGVTYQSVTEAARTLGVSRKTIYNKNK